MPFSKKPSKPRDFSHFALCQAATDGNIEEVMRLIPLIDARSVDNMALKSAVIGEYVECVKLLIPVSDVDCGGNIPLLLALKSNNQEVFDLLYPHSDHEVIQRDLKRQNEESNKMRQFIAQYENNLMHSNISHDNIVRPTKKM